MDTIDGLNAVIAVAQTQSFTSAGERLGISKALVSKYVGQLEEKAGIRLFNRTTRRVYLTEAGSAFYHHALAVVEQYQAMLDSSQAMHASIAGTLRVSAPFALGETKLASLLPNFMAEHPELKVELLLSNSSVNMIEEGIDVRLRVGSLSDSSLIARKIASYPLVVCASPDYLKSAGMPKHPDALAGHCCIVDSNYKMAEVWPFQHRQTRIEHPVSVKSQLKVNSPSAAREIAKNNGGIIVCPIFVVEDAIKKGELIELFSDYQLTTFDLHAVYPHRQYVARKVTVFIEYLRHALA